MPIADAYLICATPRTGSTLLCGLLRSTGVAGRPESYFRQPDAPAWAERWRIPRNPSGGFDYRDYLRAAVAAGTTPNGVFGARVMWGTLGELIGKLGTGYPDLAGADLDLLTRAFGRLRFIHLQREDPVAQAVSWALAEQTDRWQPGDRPAPGRKPRFDFGQIHRLVRTIATHTAAWRDWFASVDVRPHEVRYADLAADPVGVTTGVLDHLGLRPPPARAIGPQHRRQATRLNQEWIDRYRAAGRSQGESTAGLAKFAMLAYSGCVTTMNVSLPDSLKAFVEERVVEQGYGTSSEYVRDLIRRDQDRRRLRSLLLEGAESAPSGPADDGYFDSLRDRIGRPTSG